jgi:ribose transport system substrate-binding protein
LSRRRFRRMGSVVAIAATLVAAAACASTSSTSSSPTAAGAPAGSSASAALDASYRGLVGAPPTKSVPVPKNVTAWVVSCGQNLPTCSDSANGVAEAARSIGWQATVCDGKLNPDGWSSCIRQGVANAVKVIFVIGQDCSSFPGPLQEARTAHIMTIGVGANDCDVAGGKPLFTAITQRFQGMTNQQWWTKLGTLQAQWLIGKTNGKLKLLEVKMQDAVWGPWISAGLEDTVKQCSGCSIVSSIRLTNQDVGSGAIGPKFSAALLRAPSANAVAVPLDPWFLTGIAQDIQSSGRAAELAVIGGFGQQANIDLIRHGQGEDATASFNLVWDGWAGVDAALRVMAGQAVLASGIGLQVVDASHNLPASNTQFTYVPSVDFKSLYKAVWRTS